MGVGRKFQGWEVPGTWVPLLEGNLLQSLHSLYLKGPKASGLRAARGSALGSGLSCPQHFHFGALPAWSLPHPMANLGPERQKLHRLGPVCSRFTCPHLHTHTRAQLHRYAQYMHAYVHQSVHTHAQACTQFIHAHTHFRRPHPGPGAQAGQGPLGAVCCSTGQRAAVDTAGRPAAVWTWGRQQSTCSCADVVSGENPPVCALVAPLL